jgi:hypothetical protein
MRRTSGDGRMTSERPMEPCSSLADLRPGDIGFGPLTGVADPLAWLGQFILGEGFHVGRMNAGHVFVVVRGGDGASWPQVVEAMPRGARLHSIADGRLLVDVDNRWSSEFAYVRLAEDYPGQAEDAAAIARAMIGTSYSFASYAALAAWKFGIKTPRLERWIGRRGGRHNIPGGGGPLGLSVQLPREAICSVLADQAWSLTGKKIMHGVAHQCVTPGALARRLLEMTGTGQAVWTFPGR